MVTEFSDRVAGVLLGAACGDALGAGYEFGPALTAGTPVRMRGGNGFEPGEWTDDTAMSIVIARAAADHRLTGAAGQDAVAAGFLGWFHSGPKDVGIQIQAVLTSSMGATAAALTMAAAAYQSAHPDRSAGNGALMRTAPVALATLGEDDATAAQVATDIGRLTHTDPVSGEACTLWTLAIRYAVRTGTFDGLRLAVDRLPGERARYWTERLDEAERCAPAEFERNGWVVQALQGAWSAIARTPVPAGDPSQHLVLALEEAVRGGRDADTVAAIAGGLLGARWGASAIPPLWMEAVHGWPGYCADDLAVLTLGMVERSQQP